MVRVDLPESAADAALGNVERVDVLVGDQIALSAAHDSELPGCVDLYPFAGAVGLLSLALLALWLPAESWFLYR